jgi:hypothetical protein
LRKCRRTQTEQRISRTEQSPWGDDKDDDQHQKRKPVGRLRIDQGVGAFGQNAEEQTTEHRSHRLLGTASDHHCDEAVGAERVAEIRVGKGARADKHAGDASKQPGYGKSHNGHDRGIRADSRSHLWIRRDRHTQFSKKSVLAHQLKRDGENDRYRNCQQLLPVQDN